MKARITYVGHGRLYFRTIDKNETLFCPLRRLKLMRQHDFSAFFRIDQRVNLIVTTYGSSVPKFIHPHDAWWSEQKAEQSFRGRVIAVAKKDNSKLLIELKHNVLVFVTDTSGRRYQIGDEVSCVPYRYNRHTKRIYGYLE